MWQPSWPKTVANFFIQVLRPKIRSGELKWITTPDGVRCLVVAKPHA